MAKVSATTHLQVPAAILWDIIGDFDALPKWHPTVVTSVEERRGERTLRRVTLAGGAALVERLESQGGRSYTYSIVEGALPVTGYISRLAVSDTGNDCCLVEWSSEFEPVGVSESEAAAMIHGIFDAGLGSLERIFRFVGD